MKLSGKEKEKTKDEEMFKTYNASDDYQVAQAIKYLKGVNVFESINKNK